MVVVVVVVVVVDAECGRRFETNDLTVGDRRVGDANEQPTRHCADRVVSRVRRRKRVRETTILQQMCAAFLCVREGAGGGRAGMGCLRYRWRRRRRPVVIAVIFKAAAKWKLY